MITSPSKPVRILLGALLLAGVGVPALVQGQSQSQSKSQDAPESLLPPGFDEPAAPAPAPAPAAPRPAASATAGSTTSSAPLAGEPIGNSSIAAGEETLGTVDLTRYELPEYAKHSLARVGIEAWGNATFPAKSMGAADGRYVDALLKRLKAPIASRWASIALRRALMSPLDTPKNINGADYAASRAWVLLRMGEANAARAVIADVDAENYTTWLYQVAMQSSLASADPAGMCSVADEGAQVINQRGWALARAMCAGLAGKPNEAGQLLTQGRRGTNPGDIDNLLAEKVLGTGAQGRRAVTVEWQGVPALTAWRFGLATATGEQIPGELYATAGPQVRYWQALAPSVPAASRAAAAELAASAGVFSSAGLIDLYSEIAQDPEANGTPEEATARDLRAAYITGDVANRVTAIHKLWDAAKTPRTAYARLILTARAASWIPASAEVDAPEKLIASMLSAGMENAAMEWRNIVKRGSEGWALLTLAESSDARVAYGDFDVYGDVAGRRKAQLMLAGLAGLGRLDPADARRGAVALEVPIGLTNSWTKAIDAAGQRGDAAMVALLAATGLQSRTWDNVTPEGLFHIVAAMKAAGLGNYARMIAVEAISRA